MAAGHYGDFLGFPAAGLLFVAAVFTILSIPDSPPALLSVIADLYHRIAAFSDLWTMQPSPGGVTRTPPLSPRPFLVATAFFLTWQLCATSLGCLRWSHLYVAALAAR